MLSRKSVRYPAVDLRNQVEGRVFASFTVDENGDVSDVKIGERPQRHHRRGNDSRSIKALPKFIPGKQNGRAVKVSFTVPVTLTRFSKSNRLTCSKALTSLIARAFLR